MNIFDESISIYDMDDYIFNNLIPLIDEHCNHTSLVVYEYEFMDRINCREEYNEYLDGGDNEIPSYIASLLARYTEKHYGGKWDYFWTEGDFIAWKKEVVCQYTLDGELVEVWRTASEAARQLGFSASHICACCRGERKTHKGYKWSLEENDYC